MPQTRGKNKVQQNELIRFNFLLGKEAGEGGERQSPALKFQEVDKLSCLAVESTWQRWTLMHHTPAYKFVHLITSHRLQNVSNEPSGLRNTPGIMKKEAPAATMILCSACVLGDPKAFCTLAATDMKPPCWLSSRGTGYVAKGWSKTWYSSRNPAERAFYSLTHKYDKYVCVFMVHSTNTQEVNCTLHTVIYSSN